MKIILFSGLVFLLMAFLSSLAIGDSRPAKLGICVTCHGVDGRGNEVIGAPKIAGMEAWYIRDQLQGFKNQYRGIHGSDENGREMKAMADYLTHNEIDALAQWLIKWPVDVTPATISGDSTRGRKLYADCATCHGDQGQGIATLRSPALAGQNDWYLLNQLQNFSSGARGSHPDDHYGQQMKLMMNTLTDDESMRDVVSFIQALPVPDNAEK
jgi:cytochrome c oxidase subunit 2